MNKILDLENNEIGDYISYKFYTKNVITLGFGSSATDSRYMYYLKTESSLDFGLGAKYKIINNEDIVTIDIDSVVDGGYIVEERFREKIES